MGTLFLPSKSQVVDIVIVTGIYIHIVNYTDQK